MTHIYHFRVQGKTVTSSKQWFSKNLSVVLVSICGLEVNFLAKKCSFCWYVINISQIGAGDTSSNSLVGSFPPPQ